MIGVKTPLKNGAQQSYCEEEIYYEEDSELSRASKISLYGLASVLCVTCLWFFAFFLPTMFIPEATTLNGIVKVTELDVTLTPLTEEQVRNMSLDKQGDYDSSYFNEADEDSDEHEDSDENEDVDNEKINIEAKASSKGKKERLILIGDIHGHYSSFRKLLRQVKYDAKKDHILLLGDYIAKGPDSIKVLDFAIENNLDCILGNHEYYVLQNYAKYHQLAGPHFVSDSNTTESSIDVKGSFNDDPEYLLAKKLQPEHIKYINKCPVIKRLGRVPLHKSKNEGGGKFTQGIAVHGGLQWDLMSNLDDQDPIACMEMRSYVGPHFNRSTDDPAEEGAVSWSKIWNLKQKEHPKHDTTVIYYGHDARRGLKLKKFSKGIDTGCDKGNRLTAMVLWNERTKTAKGKSKILYKEKTLSVKC